MLSVFCFKSIPTLCRTNAKTYFISTETEFVLFLSFLALIICVTGMCGWNQRLRTKKRMTVLFTVIDIRVLLWPFLAGHLQCCSHLFVDLCILPKGGWVCINRRIKSKRYCSCRWPPLCIRHQIETMRAWNRGVGEGWDEEERGVKNGRSVSERSGLGAIWWRWSEVLKIDNLLDMSSAKVWPDGPQPKGVRLRHVMNVFPGSLELQSMSGGVTDEPGKKTNLYEKEETSLRRRN